MSCPIEIIDAKIGHLTGYEIDVLLDCAGLETGKVAETIIMRRRALANAT